MAWTKIRWGLALLGSVGAEVIMVAAAIAWITLYSEVLRPGESLAFYQRYASVSAPWVSLIVGVPVFYLVCRWIAGRGGDSGWLTAMTVFGLYLLIDLAFLVFGGPPVAPPWFHALNYPAKFLACHFGGRPADKRI